MNKLEKLAKLINEYNVYLKWYETICPSNKEKLGVIIIENIKYSLNDICPMPAQFKPLLSCAIDINFAMMIKAALRLQEIEIENLAIEIKDGIFKKDGYYYKVNKIVDNIVQYKRVRFDDDKTLQASFEEFSKIVGNNE